jgi:hypothetical protein
MPTMKKLTSLAAATLLLAAPKVADAFCGFYVGGANAKLFNNATQVALMREGTRTVLSMQNNYEGPTERFAMVIPVPVILQKENVKTLSRDLFAKLDSLDAPRLVEYWEQDPCRPDQVRYAMTPTASFKGSALAPSPGAKAKELGVTIEAQFEVGEYEVVILSAKDSGGLETWLKQEKYVIPDGAAPYFQPYIQAGSKFFVAKVNPEKVKFEHGQAMLSPLRFHYDSENFSLPVRLGLMNAKGPQDLIVHVLAKGQRYNVANYPNVTIPTNLDVSEDAKSRFGEFYAALFDKTMEKNPKAVVTEYSWDASTCDPCPGPALSPSDLASLGGDVMPSNVNEQAPAAAAPGSAAPILPIAPAAPGAKVKGRRFSSMGGYVVTRLHARYTKESLGDDFVFRAATAIMGGREVRSGADSALETGSSPSNYSNNFQGRYAVRHPWKGAVTCDNPRRGIWGGPPEDQISKGSVSPRAAKNTAFAPRGQLQLASFLRSPLPDLGVKAEGALVSGVSGPANSSTPTSSSAQATETPQPKAACGSCAESSADVGSLLPIAGVAVMFAASSARARKKRVPRA